MFKYAASFVSERTEHPFIFSTFIFAAIFLVTGVVVEVVTDNGVASGFLLLYASLSTALGLAAYGVLYTAKAISMARDRTEPGDRQSPRV